MPKTLTFSLLMSASLAGAAHAASVYPGCAAITAPKAGHHTFYVDPVKGSDEGNGSSAHPWKTLSSVIGSSSKLLSSQMYKRLDGTVPLTVSNPNGPIKAGDVIMLMTGDHGAIKISNAFNTDFISVMAAPGQTPVISSLSVTYASRWLFQGIKFQSTDAAAVGRSSGNHPLDGMVWTDRKVGFGATSDIAFVNNSFSSADDTAGWSSSDWLTKPFFYALWTGSVCSTVADNHFYNVLDGMAVSSKNLIQGNLIEKMANDGIDFSGSNLTIVGNTVRGGVASTSSDPLHADGIQGWPTTQNSTLPGFTSSNVQILSNFVQKIGDN